MPSLIPPVPLDTIQPYIEQQVIAHLVEQARRYAHNARRTLLLFYNKSLASWIRKTLQGEESGANIEVRTFHDFCAYACEQAKLTFVPDDPDTFWHETSAEILSDASHVIPPFDAIVVDEGQDFRESWWLAIEDCLAEEGRLMVFCDPQQNIFGADGLDAIIEGLVAKWISEEGLKPSQIAILSPWRKDKTCLVEIDQLKRIKLTSDVAACEQNKGILCTTVSAFKGLEADVLLLIDVPKPDRHKAFSQADYYVGCSRAKSALHVLAKEQAVGTLAKEA